VECLDVSSGNAGGGITVSGSIATRCPPNCPETLSSIVRFRLEGQSSHERCQGRRATIVGTSKGETLVGTNHADTIVGLDGNDRIFGRGGNDLICGGRGRDLLSGGPGRNRVSQS
jgi:Ca2+-binding RTX toxin-like protein